MTHQLDEKEVFDVAASLRDRTERNAYLDSVCGTDPTLRQRVEALLDAHESYTDFLSGGAPVDGLDEEPTTGAVKPGSIISRYKLLEQIGEGGFGIVYLAEQQEPIQRRVALKIIKAGMDTKQVIARFEAERQALALMDHPNIAKVLDAGETETGRPYFVMEVVRGDPITRYCDDRQLSTTERLHIFTEICSAVQHAHQKGIIHRDIKPTNVLVSTNGERPTPKVIDFGIAKATQGRLTDKTLFTQFRQFVGTPAYMSPEQAQMSTGDVDTRSDIYSLGILLYELLTGQTPLNSGELQEAGFEELCRRVRDVEAPRPSHRLSALSNDEISMLARNRRVDPTRLPLEYRGELDWIVMRAVEKDRSRRYATAEALSDDVTRFLNGEAVTAVPPSSWYLLQKTMRRNRRLFQTVSAVVGTLLIASIVSTWLAIQLVDNVAKKDVAVTQALEAKEIAEAEKVRARQHAYASDMNGASQALRLDNLGLARFYVNRHRATDGETDLRNWEWRALWKECRGDAVASFGLAQDINWSLCLSPDEKWLATGAEGAIRVWNLQTRKLTKTLVVNHERGRGIAFTPSSDRLYGATANGVVKSWRLPSFAESRDSIELEGKVSDLRVSPNGNRLAIASYRRSDGKVAVYQLSSDSAPEPLASIDVVDSKPKVAFSPDDQRIAIAIRQGIRIVDASTLQEQLIIPGGRTGSHEFSPDGTVLAISAGFPRKSISLHRADDGELLGQLEGHSAVTWDLAFSRNGRWLASASADHTIRLWNTETLAETAVLRGHNSEVCSVEFTPDGRHLVSGGKGEICVFYVAEQANIGWPISEEIVPYEYDGWHRQYSQASFSRDTKWLATRNKDYTASLRSPKTLEELVRLTALGENIRGVRFSPAENILAVGDSDGYLSFLDPERPEEISRIMLVEGGRVSPVGFSADGARLLVVVQEPMRTQTIIWSVPDDRQVEAWASVDTDKCAVISPDGETVVTGHTDGTARIWQVSDPAKSHHVPFDAPIFALAFAPDGRQFAVGNTALHLVDTATREIVSTLSGHSSAVHSIHFSPDGQRVATGGGIAHEAVKIWDVSTRQELMTLTTKGFSFRQIEFLPDGNSIMAIGGNHFLKVWHVPTLEEIDAEPTMGGNDPSVSSWTFGNIGAQP